MSKIEKYHIGQCDQYTKVITEEDIALFANITGDYNYIHIDEQKAKNSFFKGRIAHGMLTAGLISTVIGTKLPGEGSIYLEQNLQFLKPVRINDIITAKVSINSIDLDNSIIILDTICVNQNNKLVLKGMAKILIK